MTARPQPGHRVEHVLAEAEVVRQRGLRVEDPAVHLAVKMLEEVPEEPSSRTPADRSQST
jgi:hypothetical protein